MTTTDPCLICGVGEHQHKAQETAGDIRHAWTNTGELVVSQARLGPAPRRQPQVVIANGVDLQLRRILMDKGIISNEDFTALLDPGHSDLGDREDREAQTP